MTFILCNRSEQIGRAVEHGFAVGMALACTFKLNNQPMSMLQCPGVGNFAVFSGVGVGRDNPGAVSKFDIGPLPTGQYYIVDRESGGLLGALRDLFLKDIYGTDRSTWFALYRNDGVIDDYTFVNGVRRGNFRLHPIGPRHLSEGCITLANPKEFESLRTRLKNGPASVGRVWRHGRSHKAP